MLHIFADVRRNALFRRREYHVDSLACRFHYRLTFAALLACTVLVSHQSYIGHHIRCQAGKMFDGKEHFVNSYCFTMTTYTLPHPENHSILETSPLHPKHDLYPGIGFRDTNHPKTRHAYYQWVPYVLFLQAMLFYCPHLIWKTLEGGRLYSMVESLMTMKLPSQQHELAINNDHVIPSRDKRDTTIARVRDALADRLHTNKTWALGLIVCEVLNACNVALQLYLMHLYLGGGFFEIGLSVLANRSAVLDFVFPKMTKCIIHTIGTSGSLQAHDAICVMALNAINEKIYVFLWFWFCLVAVVTSVSLLYRLMSIALYSRSQFFHSLVFRLCCPAQLDGTALRSVQECCDYSDWLFLQYLASCVDSFVYKQLFEQLADEVEARRPRIVRHNTTEVKFVDKAGVRGSGLRVLRLWRSFVQGRFWSLS